MFQKKKPLPFTTLRRVAASMAAVVVLYLVFLFYSLQRHQAKVQLYRESNTRGMKQQPSLARSLSSSSTCSLRKYPPHRYYHLKEEKQPKFLKEDAMYIYGEWPILLQPSRKSPLSASAKLCVDQSEWLGTNADKNKDTLQEQLVTTLPFADGTNPSIINLERLSRHSMYSFLRNELGGTYLATLCMTNSQCAWRDSEDDVRHYNISKLTAPVTLRTMLLVLDEHFQTLAQATIHLDHDAAYSRLAPPKDKAQQRKLLALDDARLFLHHDQLWVSYREGKLFGYDKQVLNEVHITKLTSTVKGKQPSFQASIKASETATLCCGRNMALMEHSTGKTDTLPQLQSLTWVDPITVVNVDDGRNHGAAAAAAQRRRLSRKDNKKKSHIHGTNAFMVYLEATNEYLGIGHFHRPADRDPNPYARFGHHYTHTLFTISGSAPYRLQRISPEFVLPASYDRTDDAEIIQFASGLEVAYHDPKLLVMAYGINDCEGAAMYVDLDYINSLLRPVEEGKEVVDLMQPLR